VPKGPNGLTGVDKIDRRSYADLDPAGLLYGHGYGYAQTQEIVHEHVITENEVDDEHAAKLEQMLEDAVKGFADLVQDCRDSFQAMVDLAKSESVDRRGDLDQDFQDANDARRGSLEDLQSSTKAMLESDNNMRNDDFNGSTQETLDAINGRIDSAINEVETWFTERMTWVEEGIEDMYAVMHINHELEETRVAAVADLEARKETA
jgi:hypothetical protein